MKWLIFICLIALLISCSVHNVQVHKEKINNKNLNYHVVKSTATDILVFSKVSGPEWLTVHNDGALTGTPQFSDIGLNEFIVRVEDDLGVSDEAVLRIEVLEDSISAPFNFKIKDWI